MMIARLLIVLLLLPSMVAFCGTPLLLCFTTSALRQRHSSWSLSLGASASSHAGVPSAWDIATSTLASSVRLPGGMTVRDNAVRVKDDSELPARLLELWDVESDADCRWVREVVTELDLRVERVIPCATHSSLDCPQVPRLVAQSWDGQVRDIVGAAQIVQYLEMAFTTADTPPSSASSSAQTDRKTRTDGTSTKTRNDLMSYIHRCTMSPLASLLRGDRGSRVSAAARPSLSLTAPPRPSSRLILYSYEGNPYCRLVREVLTELDLEYTLESAGKGSKRRVALRRLRGDGTTTCPYLVDPSTNTALGESRDIIRYLYQTYASWTPPSRVLHLLSPLWLQWNEWKLNQALSNSRPPTPWQVQAAAAQIQMELAQEQQQQQQQKGAKDAASIVIYVFDDCVYCQEALALLDSIGVPYRQVSLGSWMMDFWSPWKNHHRQRNTEEMEDTEQLEEDDRASTLVALEQLSGQSTLPLLFVDGQVIGGLFTGTPGLVPALEQEWLLPMMGKTARPSSANQPVHHPAAAAAAAAAAIAPKDNEHGLSATRSLSR